MRAARRPAVESYPFPGLFGWMAVAAVVVGADVGFVRRGYPTMSRTLGHYLARPLLGPALAGGWAGLTYHLLIFELLPGLREARGEEG